MKIGVPWCLWYFKKILKTDQGSHRVLQIVAISSSFSSSASRRRRSYKFLFNYLFPELLFKGSAELRSDETFAGNTSIGEISTSASVSVPKKLSTPSLKREKNTHQDSKVSVFFRLKCWRENLKVILIDDNMSAVAVRSTSVMLSPGCIDVVRVRPE